MKQHEKKQYDIRNAAAFKKTTEQWGGLSNMAGGFPVVVNCVAIKSVEALYQACRFPHLPDVQEKILTQGSPMTAKMVGKPFREHSRDDWLAVRILVMKWCLRVKLAQNWDEFSSLLLSTQDMQIVEISNKDDFWGAKPVEQNLYVGVNALGRLLMELREQVIHNKKERFMVVPPLNIPQFKLYNQDILPVNKSDSRILATPQINMFDV
ncbi:TPA: NADAR family protein [Vibrio parahaemolyticus]|uniref:NADAR family protein n=1 Tax=Vibrio japonicus TaxID=1824638 RepID=A0ABY5LDZ0_9VIBR|nr:MULTISPECIES: NADAR family protein [Vibrio]MCE7651039.1 NADAR family protein [Vibrio fluvialis]UUM30249.1 NADAR family protein [Vibrio japonicus]HCG7260516.1 NADAR family protein [Vibrio parahaemolyticus]